MTDRPPAQQTSPAADADTAVRAELPADLASARPARTTVRQALAAWDMDRISGDAKLLASELVANAAEHGSGQPISLALHRHAEPGGRPGITCEVTDTSPAIPRRTDPSPDAERGRGLAIVTALAHSSGVRATGAGKTTWFTLALTDRAHRVARQLDHQPEAGRITRRPSKEHTAMPHPVSGPGERAQASPGYRTIQAIRDLARDRGAEFITRPNFPGSRLTVDSLEPLTGARAARDIELTSRHAARDYIRQAREAGHGWEQIGHALGITPNADADQAGLTVAEDTYAAGNPHTDTAIRYGRSFVWRCQSCDQAISDHGLIAGPHDNEIGHAENCGRLAAAVAEWDAGWEAEP
jgi:anti-sigma regulatory factor (Ser/Thr protein kinase)